MFCPKCGTENDENAEFCKSCGSTFKSAPKIQKNENKKSSNNTLLIAIAAIICICVIVGGFFFVFGNNSSDNVATSTDNIENDDSSTSVSTDDSSDNENRYADFSSSEWDKSSYALDDIYTAHTPEDAKEAMFDKADANGDGILTGDEIKEMDYLLKHSEYTWNGPGDSSTSNSGISFSEAATYFPEASETVLGHVFDEADSNSDGSLSDSELELFKTVRDHTKKYANNVKNEYSTVKPSGSEKTGYCADHGRVAVVDGSHCPYCIDLGYSDTRTKTSSW